MTTSHAPGSASEEATRLFAAAQQWVRGDHAQNHAPGHAHDRNQRSTTCQRCPLCQAVAVARGLPPEAGEHLLDAAASLAAALRAAVSPAASRADATRGRPVEHVEIDVDS